jgi:propionyl-CoA synthetase
MTKTYQQAYDAWASDPESFWAEAARGIDWAAPPATICDLAQSPGGRWFTGGTPATTPSTATSIRGGASRRPWCTSAP